MHNNHMVRWTKIKDGSFRLYCIDCGVFIQYSTSHPNSLDPQEYGTAIINGFQPISVTLEVQGIRHKSATKWR